MDKHHKANYGIAGVIGAILVGVATMVSGVKDEVKKAASHEWAELTASQATSLAAAFAALPHHEVTIYCVASCGSLPEDLSDAFVAAGWKPHIESVIASSVSGLMVGPANDEGKAIAGAIKDAVGVQPAVADQDGPDVYTVTVGRKGR